HGSAGRGRTAWTPEATRVSRPHDPVPDLGPRVTAGGGGRPGVGFPPEARTGRSDVAKWRMKGQYIKNCSCLASCPCDTIGVPAPHKFCEGVVAMNVKEGNFDGVKLDGVKWAATVHWPGALHEGNGTLEAFIDEGTSAQQRDALIKILTGQSGGTLF